MEPKNRKTQNWLGLNIPLVVYVFLGILIPKLIVVFTIFEVEFGGKTSVGSGDKGSGGGNKGQGDSFGQLCLKARLSRDRTNTVRALQVETGICFKVGEIS